MPVTAKLSRQFYERLGDDIANELVNWFNSVDLTYRAEMERRFAAIVVTIEHQGSALRDGIARSRNGLMQWMFVFWATTVLAILGLYVGG